MSDGISCESETDAAAKGAEPLPVSSTAQLRDLAASAARIFGWDTDKPGVQLNQQFVITFKDHPASKAWGRAACDGAVGFIDWLGHV